MSEQNKVQIKPVELAHVWQMRQQIMYPDFSIDEVKLKSDEQGEHLGLYIGDRLVSVVSLFIVDKELQFRKFCTHNEEQGKGYGSQLLHHVFQLAKEKYDVRSIWCNARVSAKALYERFGMELTDKTFTKDGFDFVVMKWASF